MLTGFVEQSPQCSTRCCEPFPSPSICQVKTKIFESAVLVTIVANVVLLLAEHFPQEQATESQMTIAEGETMARVKPTTYPPTHGVGPRGLRASKP